MADQSPDNQWHLDKKVPIALIVMMLAQTFAAGWWGATMAARVDQLEKQSAGRAPQAERIIRLEAKVDTIVDALADIRVIMRQQK